jgi:hypothetical protein
VSDSNVIDFPFRVPQAVDELTWTEHLVRWRCDVHGVHDQVMCVLTLEGTRRTYCIACLVDLLDRIGLRDLPQVGGK